MELINTGTNVAISIVFCRLFTAAWSTPEALPALLFAESGDVGEVVFAVPLVVDRNEAEGLDAALRVAEGAVEVFRCE